MACGCNKNGMKNISRGGTIGPIKNAISRSISQSISIQSTTPQIQAQGQASIPGPVNQTVMDEERRRIEKLRRDAIRKAFNR